MPAFITPEDRTFRALDLLESYDIPIPIELIDTSKEHGTVTGDRGLELCDQIETLTKAWVDEVLDALHEQRLQEGLEPLTQVQTDMAIAFLQGHTFWLMIDGCMAPFKKGGTYARAFPDAAADLKRALYEGAYDEEDGE